MAKKKPAPEEFNMSAVVREALTLDPKATPQTVQDFILAKHPSAAINKGSFQVAFYTARKKLGVALPRGKAKVGIRTRQQAAGGTARNGFVQIEAIKTAMELIKQAGGEADAIQLIKALGSEVRGG